MNSWIYFARFGEDGPIKIGRANDPRKRLLDLGIGTPVQLVLLGAMISEQAAVEEDELHCRLATQRVRGEWFEANAVLEEMRRLDSRLISPEQVSSRRLDDSWMKNEDLHIRVDPREVAVWRAMARALNKSLSEWVREVLNSRVASERLNESRALDGGP